jgi:hypothetical protein
MEYAVSNLNKTNLWGITVCEYVILRVPSLHQTGMQARA